MKIFLKSIYLFIYFKADYLHLGIIPEPFVPRLDKENWRLQTVWAADHLFCTLTLANKQKTESFHA